MHPAVGSTKRGPDRLGIRRNQANKVFVAGSIRERQHCPLRVRAGRVVPPGLRKRTSPVSIRGRVAFPTLRPPRLWLLEGPAPWTKRGKRTTAGRLVEVGRDRDRGGAGVAERNACRSRSPPRRRAGRRPPACRQSASRSCRTPPPPSAWRAGSCSGHPRSERGGKGPQRRPRPGSAGRSRLRCGHGTRRSWPVRHAGYAPERRRD